jgi:hypothetical protein
MIGQSKKIFLKSQFISHKKKVLIVMTQKYIAWYYYVKVLFKNIPPNTL